jgi:hypothetical protein
VHPGIQSQALRQISGDNTAKAYFRPQSPPELEFDTDMSTFIRRTTRLRAPGEKLQCGAVFDGLQATADRNSGRVVSP